MPAAIRIVFAMLGALSGLAAQADPPYRDSYSLSEKLTVELDTNRGEPKFVISGLPPQPAATISDSYAAEYAKLFEFVVYHPDRPPTAAMLGRFEQDGDALSFLPKYRLRPDITYELRYHGKQLKQPAEQRYLFRFAEDSSKPQAEVAAVYPSADTLPENLLKFYIHFSAPMNRGEAYKRIHLLRGSTEVESPFLELGEELWDRDQKRFTLFLHPGRIKRGLKPRNEDGPPLTEGEAYRLVVDQAWSSAAGGSLQAAFEKRFTVTNPDDQQLNPEQWKIETPQASSLAPVRLVFGESLDHAMLSRVLEVVDRSGNPVDGRVAIGEDESSWAFRPQTPWKTGTYNILVATNLEDLCGNSIARPFEVKMADRAASQPTTRVAVEFIVK